MDLSYRKMLSFAVLWQLPPFFCVAFTGFRRSQFDDISVLVLVIAPLAAGLWHFVAVQRPPRSHRQATIVFLITAGIAALSIAGCVGIVALMLLAAGPHF